MTSRVDLMCHYANVIYQNNTGYDQWERWSFFNRRTLALYKNAEADCSSLCGALIRLSGRPIDLLTGTFGTWNFRERATAVGYRAERFTGRHQMKRGRFLLNTNNHVEFCYSDDLLFSANKDENWGATGGKAGDQTGQEVYFKKFFLPARGWDWVLIPPTEDYADSTGVTPPSSTQFDPASKLDLDGSRGPKTITKWQWVFGTTQDGFISKDYSELIAAEQRYLNSVVAAGHIRNLTGASALAVDGSEGPKTIKVRQFVLFNWYAAAVLGRSVRGSDFDGVAGYQTTLLHQHALNRQKKGSKSYA